RSRLSPISIQSEAAAEASTQMGRRALRATSSEAITTAAPPSVNGQQSYSLSGSATSADFMTCSSVISFWNCALGFFVPCLWFFTATAAICSSVVPCLAMCARATRANTPGKVSPSVCSQRASEAYAKYSVDSSVVTLSTRSAPPTSTTSDTPLPTSITAWRKAACDDAQAVSKRVVGTAGSPSTEAACGLVWSCFSVSPPTTLP